MPSLARDTSIPFVHRLIYLVLLFFFDGISFNPRSGNNLKDYGSFIPAIGPGKRTRIPRKVMSG